MSKKKILVILGVFALCTASVFAADGLGAIDSASDKMISIISSKPVKVVCVAGLLGVFGACVWGQSQGEGGFIKKVMPVLYGIAGVLGTVGIVNWLFDGINVDSLKTGMIENAASQFLASVKQIAGTLA